MIIVHILAQGLLSKTFKAAAEHGKVAVMPTLHHHYSISYWLNGSKEGEKVTFVTRPP